MNLSSAGNANFIRNIYIMWLRRYALGGFDGRNFLNTVEIYDPRANNWMPVRSALQVLEH